MNNKAKITNALIVVLLICGVAWIASIFVHVGGEYTEKEEAADALALAEEHISTAIFAAQTDLKTAEEELVTCTKQVQLADENYSIQLNRYQNGLALITDMVDASNMKLAAEIDQEQASINILFCQKKLQYLKGAL